MPPSDDVDNTASHAWRVPVWQRPTITMVIFSQDSENAVTAEDQDAFDGEVTFGPSSA